MYHCFYIVLLGNFYVVYKKPFGSMHFQKKSKWTTKSVFLENNYELSFYLLKVLINVKFAENLVDLYIPS